MIGVNEGYQYQRLIVSGQIKADQGILGGFIVASGTPTVQIFDSLTGSGTLILNTMQTAAATAYPVPAAFTKGCYVVLVGAGDVTFFYQ